MSFIFHVVVEISGLYDLGNINNICISSGKIKVKVSENRCSTLINPTQDFMKYLPETSLFTICSNFDLILLVSFFRLLVFGSKKLLFNKICFIVSSTS